MQTNNFTCLNCQKQIPNKSLGTSNRNHCSSCLWSKHVDLDTPGDRKANCKDKMEPIGLTFKQVGLDKWGKQKQGELMIIHSCCGCNKISINRIAGDDNPEEILKVLKSSENLDRKIKDNLEQSGIDLLTQDDLPEIKTQLFGNLVV